MRVICYHSSMEELGRLAVAFLEVSHLSPHLLGKTIEWSSKKLAEKSDRRGQKRIN